MRKFTLKHLCTLHVANNLLIHLPNVNKTIHHGNHEEQELFFVLGFFFFFLHACIYKIVLGDFVSRT